MKVLTEFNNLLMMRVKRLGYIQIVGVVIYVLCK